MRLTKPDAVSQGAAMAIILRFEKTTHPDTKKPIVMVTGRKEGAEKVLTASYDPTIVGTIMGASRAVLVGLNELYPEEGLLR